MYRRSLHDTLRFGGAITTLLFASACANMSGTSSAAATTKELAASAMAKPAEIVLAKDVKFDQLNPARGDASPQAGTLWGSRKEAVGPTGFLLKFAPNFSSPPHIHPETYRSVVLQGFVNNDDPAAAKMWMPAGSFWVQPKGEVHITEATENGGMGLVEIEMGPYLVQPTSMAFETKERPINIDVVNQVWSPAPSLSGGVYTTMLWGDPAGDAKGGLFLKVEPGKSAVVSGEGQLLRLVVVHGTPAVWTGGAEPQKFVMGDYVGTKGPNRVSCEGAEACELYIRTEGSFKLLAE